MKEGYEEYEEYEGSERYGYEGSDISVQLTMIQSLISVLLIRDGNGRLWSVIGQSRSVKDVLTDRPRS